MRLTPSPQKTQNKSTNKRISNLKEWLDSEEETFTEGQKNYLIHQYESLKTPFYYKYVDGWSALLQNISTFILILALIIGFLVSGIFSDEFQAKADSIFFSSKLGRNKAILSKMGAGFLITSVFYIVFVLLYTFIVLWALGADGANCPIQLDLWRSIYNITFFQAYLLYCSRRLYRYFICLYAFYACIRGSTFYCDSIIVPFISIVRLSFFEQDHYIASDLLVLPGPAARGIYLHQDFALVEIGGKVMDIAGVILPAYLAACLLLQPVLYRIYKKAEVR